ncbi:hypothetical protein BaRGS_00011153, partial [Batillaria attramentaria]
TQADAAFAWGLPAVSSTQDDAQLGVCKVCLKGLRHFESSATARKSPNIGRIGFYVLFSL